METTDTTTFTAIRSEGEQALIEWEQRIRDGGHRYMNRETVRLLLKAFRSDGRFMDAAMLAVLAPEATHTQLLDVYRGRGLSQSLGVNAMGHHPLTESTASRLVSRGLSSPHSGMLLDALDADLSALIDVDKTSRMDNVNLWAFRAFLAWVGGDPETASRHAGIARVLDDGTSAMTALMVGILKTGITITGGETRRYDVAA